MKTGKAHGSGIRMERSGKCGPSCQPSLKSKERSGPGNLPESWGCSCLYLQLQLQGKPWNWITSPRQKNAATANGQPEGSVPRASIPNLTPLLTSDLPLAQPGTREPGSQLLCRISIMDAVIVFSRETESTAKRIHTAEGRGRGDGLTTDQRGDILFILRN